MLTDGLTVLNAQLNQLNLQRRKALNDFLDLKGKFFFFFFLLTEVHDSSVFLFEMVVSRPLLRIYSHRIYSHGYGRTGFYHTLV